MLDEWLEFDSSYVAAGKFSLPAGAKLPAKPRQLGTLWCRMKGKGLKPDVICRYDNVPYTVWVGLLEAASKGTYHHRAIRPLGYKIES